MSIVDLALLLRVSKQTVSHWEVGQHTPDLATAMLLELVLEHDVTVEQIVPATTFAVLRRWVDARGARQRQGAVP